MQVKSIKRPTQHRPGQGPQKESEVVYNANLRPPLTRNPIFVAFNGE